MKPLKPRHIASLLGLLATTAFPAPASAAQDSCPDADATPSGENSEQIARAVLCLHNRARSEGGLRKLRINARLSRAARKHSAAMIEQRFFDHRGMPDVSNGPVTAEATDAGRRARTSAKGLDPPPPHR